MIRISIFLLGTALALTACSSDKEVENGQYWQRVSASDAAYQVGPKAQQMLNRDIGRCVTELRELENLGQLKNTIPTDKHGRVLNPDEMPASDTPAHDGALLTEPGDYHDFEGCMLAKGWERTKYVPYDVYGRAQVNYQKAQYDAKPAAAPRASSNTTTRATGEPSGISGALFND